MEIRTIWMSPDTAGKSRYALRTLGGSAGIAVLSLLLGCGALAALMFLLGSFVSKERIVFYFLLEVDSI